MITRRSFIQLAAATGASVLCKGTTLASAAGDVRIGVVGVRTKGWDHVTQLRKIRGVRIVAVCDADQAVLDRRIADLAKAGIKAAPFRDFRKMLEMKDLDAVTIATPNHQHTLQTIWACQAGKDVYVEKPVSHNLFESEQLAVVAEKYGRVVQAGTQKRSDEGHIQAFDFIRKGNLGKIKLVRGFCHRMRPSIGTAKGPLPIPASVDYNLWAGPAPMEPVMRCRFHYDWHWFWTTGCGEIGNQGPHELDLGRWVLGESELPRRVISVGGRLGYSDDGQTPNTQLVLYDYPTAPMLFQVRGLPLKKGYEDTDAFRGIRVGVVVECEQGYFAASDGGGWVYDWANKKVRQFTGDAGARHMANFIDAVRARRPQDLRGPVREGAISAGLGHFANLSYRVGTASQPEAIREKLVANRDASEAFGKLLTHLDANKVDVKKTPLTLGGWLEWSNSEKHFTGGEGFEQANGWISRVYREPFVVPKLA